MEGKIIVTYRELTLDRKEQAEIFKAINDARYEMFVREGEEGRILRRSELKNKRFLVIEHKKENPTILGPVLVGLVRTKVNEKEDTLTGIRVFRCGGIRTYKEAKYNLDVYGEYWRAWTRTPECEKEW